jgi:hypothetical protein
MTKPSSIQKLATTSKYIRMFLVAHQGWGKTVFCGTAPNALFLTTDPEGTLSAQSLGSNAQEWEIRSWDDLEEAYRWLRDEGHKEYDFVIVDNVTVAQRLAMRESMQISKKMSNNPDKLDPYVPAQGDYNRNQHMIVQFVMKMFDLPMHVIFTSHIKGMEDAEGEPFYSANIHGQQGGIANECLGYANIVGMGESRMAKNDRIIRRLWFSHYEAYRGKDRYVVLGNYKDDITVPDMLALIGERLTAGAPTKKTSAATKAGSGTPAAKRRTVNRRRTA